MFLSGAEGLMRKALFAVISAVMFASCSFWNEPVEEFFSYWSSEAFVTDSSVKVPNQSDKAGVVSVSSDAPAEVILNLSNPKSFRFVMPAVGNSEMIRFGGLETQPVPGTDYTLTQMSSDALKLTYKTAFLKQHEWGNGDLGATLTLFADDGRKFKKPYSFNLKANTPPPAPTFILAKTAAPSEEYVLCLKVAASEMTRMVNGELLHKDIAKIDIGGSVYDLKVNAARTDFVKPADAHFIDYADAAQLTMPPQPAVPAGAWVLYYKTDVSVGIDAYREYPVRLIDKEGLVSETLTAGTATTEPPPENVTVTKGEQGTGSGTYTDPFIIKGAASAPEARLQIGNVAGTTVHCKVTEASSTAAPAQYDGNPVTFPLTLNGGDDKLYKVEYYTDGTGFKPSQLKTKYYKVAKSYMITFSVDGQGGSLTGTYNGSAHTAPSGGTKTVRAAAGEMISFSAAAESADYAVHSWTGVTASPPSGTTAALTVTGDATVIVKFYATTLDGSSHSAEAWKKLKELIAAAPAGGTLKISGTIQSTTAPGNSGEIIIDKDLTIQGKTGAASDILDANEGAFTDKKDKHRIFHVKDGKTLTLKNLTLTKGAVGNKAAAGGYGTMGGGILLESGTVSLSDVTLSGCRAITDSGVGGLHGMGGGIYVESGNIIMENTTLSANKADAYGGAVYLKGGTLTMKGSTVITESSNGDASKRNIHAVRLAEGAKINVDGALTGSVPVARITMAYGEYLPTRQVLDGTAVDSNNAKFIVTDQELGTDNHHNHVRKWSIKSDGYLQSEEVTLDGSKTRAWQALKDAVRTASDGDVIAINGTIQATNLGTGDYVDNGEIVIDKNLTIKGKTGSATDILDANKDAGGKPKHRIFTVRVGNTLTLDNITLQGGMTEGSEQNNNHGGGVYVDGTLIMKGSSKITDCSAAGEGGGLFLYGTCTLQDSSSITHCEARDYGGGVCVDYYGRSILNINGGSITMNRTKKVSSSAGHGGGVYVRGNSGAKGKVVMTAGEISDNKAGFNSGSTYEGDGGGVYTNGIFEMSGGVIKNNNAKNGGGIYAAGAGATLTMSGGTISANKAVTDPSAPSGQQGGAGGGIFIGSGAKLTISGSAVVGGDQYHDGTDTNKTRGNSAAVGGGIYLMKGSEKTKITGGSITYNKADSIGGGIYMMDNGAEAEMTGGSITHNKGGKSGGGVYISDYNSTPRSLFTLKGGTVSYNTAKNGGGITAFGDFNMDGGSIEENTATGDSDPRLNLGTGGGIDLVAATMNMTGGEIKKNKAKRGGGVSIGLSGARDAVLNMSGGTISGNTLTETSGKGAGVEFFTESTTHGSTTYYTRMKMSGSAKVDTNNDVYLNNSRMITVDGELTGSAPVACLTPKNYSASLQVLEAGTGVNLASEAGKFTVTPKSGTPPEYWGINNTGNLTQDKTSIFNAISNDQIKAAESSMTATQIIDRKANLLGKLVLYKTSESNYGIMHVTEVDNTSNGGKGRMKFDYKTFNSDGSIKKKGNGKTVLGTYNFDLDNGASSASGGTDFWLENSNSSDAGKLFKPGNGAKFYVLP